MKLIGVLLLLLALDASATTEEEATKLAVTTLAGELQVDESEIEAFRVSRFDWPSSALGCPKRGLVYSDVIIPGYLALLVSQGAQYRVHVGSGKAIVCHLREIPRGIPEVLTTHLENLAVGDLAQQLNMDSSAITVVSTDPTIWSDDEFGCSRTESNKSVNSDKKIRGYIIKLNANDREFEYRTDQRTVRPCPAIKNF